MSPAMLRQALGNVRFARPVTMGDLEALREALRALLPKGTILDIVERANHVDVTAYDVIDPVTAHRATVPIV